MIDILYTDTAEGELVLELQVLLQQLQFTSRDVSLGWNIFDQYDNIVNSSLRYYVYTSDCNLRNTVTVANTTKTSATINLNGREDTHYNIIALDENGEEYSTINEIFRIDSGGNNV